MNPPSLPWLTPLWDQLQHYRSQQRMPSALLISTPTDLGQRSLVDDFAQAVFCTNAHVNGLACGACVACTLFEAGNYPDYVVLEPDPDRQVIKVDAVRQWCASLALNPQFERHRIALIDQAHLMNHAAANSLLKTLEEPSRDTTILLLSERTSALSATIRSRCQQLTISGGELDSMESWLSDQGCQSAREYMHLALGSPVRARELWKANALDVHNKLFRSFTSLVFGKADPLKVAEQFLAHYPQPMLGFITAWIMDLIRIKSGADKGDLQAQGHFKDLKMTESQLDLEQLFDLLQRIYRANAEQQNQLNQQLLLEDLLIHCGPYGLEHQH